MYILGYKGEDENGYPYIDEIIGYCESKEAAKNHRDKLIEQSKQQDIENKKKRKQKSIEIRSYVMTNYDKICKLGSAHTTISNRSPTGVDENLVDFLVNNPGYVQQILGDTGCPRYEYDPGVQLSKISFIIRKVSKLD